jgi:vancomycin resistance protein YoaR
MKRLTLQQKVDKLAKQTKKKREDNSLENKKGSNYLKKVKPNIKTEHMETIEKFKKKYPKLNV